MDAFDELTKNHGHVSFHTIVWIQVRDYVARRKKNVHHFGSGKIDNRGAADVWKK